MIVIQMGQKNEPKRYCFLFVHTDYTDYFYKGDRFIYEDQYQQSFGCLRSLVPVVVNKFFDCGDLEHGFACVRCDHCKREFLLTFSCKGRWFCPSCHQKKVQLFGELLTETILCPVPHQVIVDYRLTIWEVAF
ncbi:MAG: hypothetical protein EOL87_11570 [Spartobacteria bacterium]|nr:hypothetical protein [Spartobacteria bacterium]